MGKVTKKMLEEYRKTKADIPILQAELENMRQGEVGIGTSVIMDYKKGYPRPQSVSGFDWPLYERRQKALQKKQENCQAVERWIEEIDDGRTRCVFRMYYIEGLGWEKIAAKLGYHGKPDYPRLHVRDKYLKKILKK